MTSSAPSQAFSPRLDAEQSLQRLLDLIRDSRTIRDITAERLQQTFGVAFGSDAGRLGFGERLTGDWWSSFEFDPANTDGPRFEFSFRPDPPGTYPPLSDICKVDFDRFAAELQTMGFKRETYRGEHNRVIPARRAAGHRPYPRRSRRSAGKNHPCLRADGADPLSAG